MGNIFRFLLVLPCITLLLYSCESEIENEIQSSTEKLNLSGLESDSLQLESYELSEMTDELKALKERIDELKKAKTRSVASSNYSQYFSELFLTIMVNTFQKICGLLESYPSHLALEVDIYHVLVGDRE